MFRIALLSRWHVHSHKNDQRYVKEFLSQPDCKVVCVWDKDPETAREWGEEYGVQWYTDLESLLSRDDVDAGKIGILGICGWGGLAINAAAVDTRVKATVASTMYDMTRVTANGYFDKEDSAAARKAKKEAMNAQRIKDFKSGTYELGGGVPDKLPADAPQFVKDYYAYYKTPRGYHARSLNSNGGWNKTSALSFINAKLLAYADEIESAVMVLHGEKAHSRYFGETAFKMLKGGNKELVIVPGASHCDLYDGGGKGAIPFDRIEAFYRKNLK